MDHCELTSGGLPCYISQPDRGEIRRVVLGVHGLGGSAADPIQCAIAEEMQLFSAATIRFDLPGHGESPCKDFTLDNCVQTLLSAADFAKVRFPETQDLCIFATGFGAYVTLLCLEVLTDLPGRIRLVVQTPSVLMHETLLSMLNMSEPTFRAIEEVTLPLPRPLKITHRLYREVRENIVLTGYSLPFLILQGEEDAFIPMDHIRQLRRLNENAKLVVIPGASHRFLEEGAWDMVLDLTRDWFEFQQVLVTDWE